ncbi:hypothetical protein ACF0H5_005870 [Mactra antiquata]
MSRSLCRRRGTKRNVIVFTAMAIVICISMNIIASNFLKHHSKSPGFMQKYLKLKTEGLSKKGGNSNSSNKESYQTCVHPSLPLWGPEVDNYMESIEPVECSNDEDWVYTGNGRFYISEAAKRKHGRIKCAYIPIVNVNDSFKPLKTVFPMLNNSVLLSDAFKVSCKAMNGNKYANIHACIAPTTPRIHVENHKRDGFNVLIFGFDSLSRQMFKRFLPKTHEYFTETLKGTLFESYNIIGDGTVQALLPMLTGKQEMEIPEVRRGKKGAKHVDEVVEFVWTKYERKGYITQWTEDLANVGTFNYRMLGFENQPVNHYMRPFYLAAAPLYSYFKRYCLGSRTRHQVFLDWLKEGLENYKDGNFFTFGFFSEYTHDNNNPVRLADDDNVRFLRWLNDTGILENTFLVVMSDHGVRYGSIRQTELGKLEERMPYYGIYAPSKFRLKHPAKYAALMKNSRRLVIPSDIHRTLLDIIDEKADQNNSVVESYSLFTEIPKERTCADAGIEPHWCACLNSKPVPVSDAIVISSVKTILSKINEILEIVAYSCRKLSLNKILKSVSMETRSEVLKFKKSADLDGRKADLSDKMEAQYMYYQVTFETNPNNGVYEATALVNKKTGDISVNEREISRLNHYHNDPECIAELYPALRPYCVCKR